MLRSSMTGRSSYCTAAAASMCKHGSITLEPVSMLSPNFTWIGSGYMPVIIFLVTAVIFHIALRYTRYGKFTYAIGANPQAARVSGINVGRHLIIVYTIAGLLSGLAESLPRLARRPVRQAWAWAMNLMRSLRP